MKSALTTPQKHALKNHALRWPFCISMAMTSHARLATDDDDDLQMQHLCLGAQKKKNNGKRKTCTFPLAASKAFATLTSSVFLFFLFFFFCSFSAYSFLGCFFFIICLPWLFALLRIWHGFNARMQLQMLCVSLWWANICLPPTNSSRRTVATPDWLERNLGQEECRVSFG